MQLVWSLRRAGAERVAVSFALELAARGHNTHIVVLGSEVTYANELSGSSVVLHTLQAFTGPVRFYDVGTRRQIRRSLAATLASLRPDVVNVHDSISLAWGGPILRDAKTRTFFTIHGLDPFLTGTSLADRWHKFRLQRALHQTNAEILAVSVGLAKRTAQAIGRPVDYQPNPLDRRFLITPDVIENGLPYALMACTLYGLKRVQCGIKALQYLPRLTLKIAGDGPDRPRLEELAVRLAVAPRVEFLGERQDMRALMRSASVVWVLSEREGFSMTALEAMASDTPVIATDVPFLNELVRPDLNGVLVPVDDPGALAAATRALFEDRTQRDRLIYGGRRTAAIHDASEVTKLLEARYARH